jgi:hypothetical protein
MSKYVILSAKKPFTTSNFPKVYEFLRKKTGCSQIRYLRDVSVFFSHDLPIESLWPVIKGLLEPGDQIVMFDITTGVYELAGAAKSTMSQFLENEP